jgi:hypothetical protein
MADYQLRARIPHELADQVKDLIEEVNEAFPAAEATFSTVARQALESFVKRSLFGRNKIVSLELPIKDLGKEQLQQVLDGLSLIFDVVKDEKIKDAMERVISDIEMCEFREYKEKRKRGE